MDELELPFDLPNEEEEMRQHVLRVIQCIITKEKESPRVVLDLIASHAESLGYGVIADVTNSLLNPIHVFRCLIDDTYPQFDENKEASEEHVYSFAIFLFVMLLFSDYTARSKIREILKPNLQDVKFIDYCVALGDNVRL
jgi:hypothetical protein